MKHLIIKRVHTGDFGTFGVLMEKDHSPFALTLEPPWKNNAVNISCIPAGTYTCRLVDSPRFGKVWEVVDVLGRTHIVFHKGNIAGIEDSDTLGCILVGERFDLLGSIPAVLSSKDGYGEFMELVEDERVFKLSIRNHFEISFMETASKILKWVKECWIDNKGK